jgi:hypothetical protein
MSADTILIDYPGTYGGTASRDELLRLLKEALALVENTSSDAQLMCSGVRIEVLDHGSVAEGTPPTGN